MKRADYAACGIMLALVVALSLLAGASPGLLSPQPAGVVFSGPASGVDAPPAFRRLTPADIPGLPANWITSGTIDPKRLPGAITPAVGPSGIGRRTFVPALPTDGSDCAPAIQAAIDACFSAEALATGSHNWSGRGRVLIPSGTWTVKTPVWWDADYCELTGEGMYSSLIRGQGALPPILVMRRRAAWDRTANNGAWAKTPSIFAADHRVDCFGKLDASAAPNPGRLWGLTSKSPTSGSPYADHFLAVQSAAPATGHDGDQWYGVRTLCLDFCLEGAAEGYLFGLGDTNWDWGGPSPWTLDVVNDGADHLQYHLRYQIDEAPGSRYDLTWGGFVPGLTRVSVQLDVATGTARAWVDGREQAVARDGGPPPAGAHFRRNKLASFKVWNGYGLDQTWQVPPAQRPAFTLYGLYIGTSPDYTANAAGTQARADGKPLDDAYRYLGAGRDPSNELARLWTADPPVTDYPGRIVRFHTGQNVWPMGVFLPDSTDTPGGSSVTNTAIRDLAVEGQSVGGGAGIALGQLLHLTLSNVRAHGSTHGIGGFNVGANYDILMTGILDLFGVDAWYQGTSQIIRAGSAELARNPVGNSAVRLASCDALFCPITTAGPTSNPSGQRRVVEVLRGFHDYAQSYKFPLINDDNEGSAPAYPLIYCERQWNGYDSTRLEVGSVYTGVNDPDVPAVWLADVGGGGPAYASIGYVRGTVKASGAWKPAPPAWQAAGGVR